MWHGEIVVVGGGVAGLIAALETARHGKQVVLFEQSSDIGGRAATTRQQSFELNLGPHALFAAGALHRALRSNGVAVHAKPPDLSAGAFLVSEGRKFLFPTGLAGLIGTGALGPAEKVQAARLLALLRGGQPAGDQSLGAWLDAARASGKPRRLVEALVALETYSCDFNHLSAAAVLEQFRSVFRHGVLYVDHGWRTMVDEFASKARAAGVRMETSRPVERVGVRSVRLADGTEFQPEGIVLAIPPGAVRRLTSRPLPPMTPVRAAVLDIALTSLSPGGVGFALGIDPPLYYSVHSKAAALAPEDGAVVHLAKYLGMNEDGSREELDRFADLLMPGWRERVAYSRFLPNLTVTHAVPDGHRPDVDALGLDGVAIAGDWVGNDSMLGDAAASSALRAAQWLLNREVDAGSLTAVH